MLDVEHAMLAEKFQDLLEQERRAEQTYADLAARALDPAARQQLELLAREKRHHVELVQRLLEIVD